MSEHKKQRMGKRYCAVEHCWNMQPGHSFFRFPINSERRKLWLNALKVPKSDENVITRRFLCDAHFKPSDINRFKGLKKTRLLPNAIPSLNIDPNEKPVTPSLNFHDYSICASEPEEIPTDFEHVVIKQEIDIDNDNNFEDTSTVIEAAPKKKQKTDGANVKTSFALKKIAPKPEIIALPSLVPIKSLPKQNADETVNVSGVKMGSLVPISTCGALGALNSPVSMPKLQRIGSSKAPVVIKVAPNYEKNTTNSSILFKVLQQTEKVKKKQPVYICMAPKSANGTVALSASGTKSASDTFALSASGTKGASGAVAQRASGTVALSASGAAALSASGSAAQRASGTKSASDTPALSARVTVAQRASGTIAQSASGTAATKQVIIRRTLKFPPNKYIGAPPKTTGIAPKSIVIAPKKTNTTPKQQIINSPPIKTNETPENTSVSLISDDERPVRVDRQRHSILDEAGVGRKNLTASERSLLRVANVYKRKLREAQAKLKIHAVPVNVEKILHSAIDDLQNVSDVGKILIAALFRNSNKGKKGARWSLEEKNLCTALMKNSPKGYDAMRKHFGFPSGRTLQITAANAKKSSEDSLSVAINDFSECFGEDMLFGDFHES